MDTGHEESTGARTFQSMRREGRNCVWTMAWTGKLRVDVDVCGYGRGGVYRRVAWMSKKRVNVNERYIYAGGSGRACIARIWMRVWNA